MSQEYLTQIKVLLTGNQIPGTKQKFLLQGKFLVRLLCHSGSKKSNSSNGNHKKALKGFNSHEDKFLP